MPFPWPAILSFLLAAVSVPWFARRLAGPSWRDFPRADRHHRHPVSKAGGIGWLFGALAGLIGAGMQPVHGIVCLALVLAFLLGRADDLSRVPKGAKWILQTLLLGGTWIWILRMQGLPWPYAEGGGAALIPFVAAGITALGVQTALEIFDNMDAALPTTALASLAGLALGGGSSWLGPAGWAGAGASLGILIWNWPPAKVHLGNAGSYPVALLVSLLLFEFLRPSAPGVVPIPPVPSQFSRWWILLPLLWPLADLLFVTCGRIRRGVPPWQGGRDHTTHRLARFLGSDNTAAALIAGVSCVALGLALWLLGGHRQ